MREVEFIASPSRGPEQHFPNFRTSSPPADALRPSGAGHATRRGLLAGIPAAAVPATATEEPRSIDALLEGCDRKLKREIMETVCGFVRACEDAKTGATDPVFVAIEAHKQAMADLQVKVEPITKVVNPDLEDEDAFAEACDRARDAAGIPADGADDNCRRNGRSGVRVITDVSGAAPALSMPSA
jgi:hypothetical protein